MIGTNNLECNTDKEIAEDIKKHLVSTGITDIDLSAQLINSNGLADLSLFLDGLHPNEKGYERIL